jgi:hypothetical protein
VASRKIVRTASVVVKRRVADSLCGLSATLFFNATKIDCLTCSRSRKLPENGRDGSSRTQQDETAAGRSIVALKFKECLDAQL